MNSVAIELAANPKRIKTTERPIEKLIALNKTLFFIVFLLYLISLTVVPAIYARYGGRIGKTHGDRKLNTPANKHNNALRIIDEENISMSSIRLYIVCLERIPVILLLKVSGWGNHRK